MAKIKVKAKIKNGVVRAKAMAKHEMMTYNIAEKKLGDRNKANFITHITATCNGETVLDMSTSQFMSKNPIIKFKFKSDVCKKGDKLIMSWIDKSGKTATGKGKIK
jgi:sulfur-oxidizing protein SoxZ